MPGTLVPTMVLIVSEPSNCFLVGLPRVWRFYNFKKDFTVGLLVIIPRALTGVSALGVQLRSVHRFHITREMPFPHVFDEEVGLP